MNYQIYLVQLYKYIKTNGGILLNPQKLCLGLVPKICKGIDVYENTKIEKFDIDQGALAYTNEGLKIQAKNNCCNKFRMPKLKIKQDFSIL